MSADAPAYARATVTAYEVYAARAIASWARARRPSAWLIRFAARLPAQGRVLDYGCGIGTDLTWLRARGFLVEGLDASRRFVAEARRRCPGVAVARAWFETVALPAAAYDGIWCQAALMHVPPEGMPAQLEKLRRALKPGGWLGLTLAWGRSRRVLDADWIPGRYVASYTKAEALAWLRSWTRMESRVAVHDGRGGRWVQLLASPGGG